MTPMLPPSICAAPGCDRLAEPGFHRCAAHATEWAHGVSGRAMPENWAETRKRILARDRRTCRVCGRTAAEVDHVVRGNGDHDGNLQALCAPCHRVKTQTEAAAARLAGDRPGA